MTNVFLKTKENDLDKLYNSIINEASACSGILSSDFISSTVKEQRDVYGDIEGNTIKTLLEDIKLNKSRTNIAKNDYYKYVNEKWIKSQERVIKNTQLPFIKVDTFRVFQRQTNAAVLLVLDKYITANKNNPEVDNLLNFVFSSINCNFIDPAINSLECCTNIQRFIETDDLYGLLGSMNSNEFLNNRCPIYSFLMANLDDASVYNMSITLPNLSLPTYSFYYK